MLKQSRSKQTANTTVRPTDQTSESVLERVEGLLRAWIDGSAGEIHAKPKSVPTKSETIVHCGSTVIVIGARRSIRAAAGHVAIIIISGYRPRCASLWAGGGGGGDATQVSSNAPNSHILTHSFLLLLLLLLALLAARPAAARLRIVHITSGRRRA